ncbi:MAG: hypothetical protein GXO22_03025 [Aquificae bacterium]|nr:hypothetical protein [Aquificota bacterium]
MKKEVLLFIFGTLFGAGVAYYTVENKKEIMKKINKLEEKLDQLEVDEKVKNLLKDLTDQISQIVEKVQDMTEKERKVILKTIDEKVSKLEKLLKR